MNPLFFFLHLAHLASIKGSTKTEVISANAMVITIITPNWACGGIGAKISIPNPSIVVSAAIKRAPHVFSMVSQRAAVISPVLSATSLNLSVA